MHETDNDTTPVEQPTTATTMSASREADMAPGPLGELPGYADWHAIADRLYQDNRKLVARVEALKTALQATQQTLDIERVKSSSITELETEKKLALGNALQACQSLNQEQFRTIATLSERLEVSQDRAQQLEGECLALQAACHEQAERTSRAQHEMQSLREGLERHRRQSLQVQAALDRYLREAALKNNHSNAWPPPIIGIRETDEADRDPSAASSAASFAADDLWDSEPPEDPGSDDINIIGTIADLKTVADTTVPTSTAADLFVSVVPAGTSKKIKSFAAIELPQF